MGIKANRVGFQGFSFDEFVNQDDQHIGSAFGRR
jgi:hypothetical protein